MVFGIIIFVIIVICAAGFYIERRETERMWRELDESRKRNREKFNEQLKSIGRIRERREREEAASRRVSAPQSRSESRRRDSANDDDVPGLVSISSASTPATDYWFPTSTPVADDTPTRTTYSSGGGGDFSGGGASGGWSSSDSPSSSYDSSSSSSSSDSGGGGGGGSD